MKTFPLAVALASALIGSTAWAAPGDAEAVVERCGRPLSEKSGLSQVTNLWQRDFYYPDDVILHFQPMNGGWNLANAWVKHLPATREGVAERFPCIREALESASAVAAPDIDPTIASQGTERLLGEREGGIPFLWLIFFLLVGLVLVMAIPSARSRMKKPEKPAPRIFRRKPEIVIEEERRSSGNHRTSKS